MGVMEQGGDPTGTGTGGQSVYGKPFWDEFDSRLTHSGRGVLSMANRCFPFCCLAGFRSLPPPTSRRILVNGITVCMLMVAYGSCSGQNTNGSQFFILYKSAPHLDYKHTVFGKVVGGLETLTKMERVPVDDDDRPRQVSVIHYTRQYPAALAGCLFFVSTSGCCDMLARTEAGAVMPNERAVFTKHDVMQEIKITGATIFVNPFREEMEAEEEEKRLEVRHHGSY